MTPDQLSHAEKDELITLTKRALELVCCRLALYEGKDSPFADPEQWIGQAYLSLNVKGWKK